MDNYKFKYRFRFNNDFFNEPIETDNFTIYQIGDLFCDSDTEIGEHPQNMQIELSFVDDGQGVITSNGVPSEVSKGDIYLSIAGDTHSISSNNTNTMRFLYTALNVKPDSPLFKISKYLASKHKCETSRVFHFPYVFPQMTNILSEITYKNDYYIQLIDDNLSQILISLYRNSNHQADSLNKYRIDSKNSMIYNIANYICKNLLSITSLQDLSKEFSYDYSYISKRFKQVMNKPMQTYLQEKKLEYSKFLLTQEHKSVTKTAEMLNYSSIHNFSRAFKKQYGVSPQELGRKESADSKKTQ